LVAAGFSLAALLMAPASAVGPFAIDTVITVALCAIGALLLSVATMGRRELVPQLAE
jgi:hypothetical protein